MHAQHNFATRSVLVGNKQSGARRRGSDRSGDGKATKRTFIALVRHATWCKNKIRILA